MRDVAIPGFRLSPATPPMPARRATTKAELADLVASSKDSGLLQPFVVSFDAAQVGRLGPGTHSPYRALSAMEQASEQIVRVAPGAWVDPLSGLLLLNHAAPAVLAVFRVIRAVEEGPVLSAPQLH